MRKLKIWNGRDWDCKGGRLYVCAYSVRDAADLANEACRKVKGLELEGRVDVKVVSVCEIGKYWSAGCWGKGMEEVAQERGVWWGEADGRGMSVKPERVL